MLNLNHFRCPYCLNAIRPKEVEKGSLKLYQCPDCSSELHRDYVTRNDIPSYSVGFIGFPGHGKTVYLTSLFYILGQMQNKWPGFFFKSLDDHSHDLLYTQVPEFGGNPGRLPAKTPTTFNAPALVLFNKIPDVGDCCISFYDISGETYTQSGAISDRGKFVAMANVVLLLMSLPSTDESWASRSQTWTNEIQRMLDSYLHAVHNRMGLDLKERQNLIVVLTKADLLNANAKFSKDFGADLTNGGYEQYLDLLKASTSVGGISGRLKGWLLKNGAAGFVNMAEGHFKSVSYTMVSATGGRTEGAVMTAPISPSDPKRVLDPLVKILEKEMKAREKTMRDLQKNRKDVELWKKCSSASFKEKKAAYEQYIKEMPDGKFVEIAKRNVALLKFTPYIKFIVPFIMSIVFLVGWKHLTHKEAPESAPVPVVEAPKPPVQAPIVSPSPGPEQVVKPPPANNVRVLTTGFWDISPKNGCTDFWIYLETGYTLFFSQNSDKYSIVLEDGRKYKMWKIDEYNQLIKDGLSQKFYIETLNKITTNDEGKDFNVSVSVDKTRPAKKAKKAKKRIT